jgi:acetyl esterase/lipase
MTDDSALAIDPQVLVGLAPILAAGASNDAPPPAVGDVATRRANSRNTFALMAAARPPVPGIDVTYYRLPRDDGATLPLTWYRRDTVEQPGSAALYIHGGGMMLSLDETGALYDSVVRGYVAASGVPMLVVDYRAAPEHPHPTPVHDCLAALHWLAAHCAELEFDAGRLAVMGDSAGGGLAAGVCLLSRDGGGPVIAQQVLIYPMLDDRTSTPDARLLPFLTWTYDDNVTGWHALLGDRAGTDDVPSYAAPAREIDPSGLPATFLDVGQLDIFRPETVRYAEALAAAGVPTELHVHPGCPHAFELVAPGADVSLRAVADRVRRLRAV